ncbi:hypothetical protein FXO38_14218 [Capsicum annuum]|nr:hypothetical protein FXO38_14218 [Capsicum annuum]
MFNLLQQINHLLYGSLFLFPSRLLLYGFARIKASATIDADTSDELCCGSIPHRLCVSKHGLVRTKASGAIDADTSCELCCGSIPHSLCVWLNPNYAVKVKSLEKLLGDSEFQLSSYIASTKKSTRDSEHRLQHPVASAEASYGIRSIHVDGNDALAVFTAVQEARKIAVNEHKTVLVESRVQTKQNAGADKRQQYKGVVGSGFNSDRQPYQFLVLVKLLP